MLMANERSGGPMLVAGDSLTRWWRRQKAPVFASEVEPSGNGTVWSMSDWWAWRMQPGKRQVRSRAQTNRRSAAGGR